MIFLLLGCIAAGIYYLFFFESQKSGELTAGTEQILEVERKDLVSSLSVLGKSKIKNEQSLNFNTTGKVTGVYVELGQKVEKGTLLAQIDNTEIRGSIQEARINLENAQLKYKNLEESRGIEREKLENDLENKKRELDKKTTDFLLLEQEQDIIKANQKISVENTKLEFQKAETELTNSLKALGRLPDEKLLDIQDLKNTLAQQKKDYEREYALLDVTLQKQVNTYNINLQTEYYTLINMLRGVDTLLKDYNEFLRLIPDVEVKNTDLKTYFSAKNSGYKTDAVTYFYETSSKYKDLEKLVSRKTTLADTDTLLRVLAQEISLSKSLYQLSKNMSLGVDNTLFSLGVADESTFLSLQAQANSSMIQSTNNITEFQKKEDEVKLLLQPKDENEKKVSELQTKKLQIEKSQYTLLKAEENLEDTSGINSFETQKLKLSLETKKNELRLKELESQKLSDTQEYELENITANIGDLDITLREAQDTLNEYNSPNNETFALAESSVRQAQIALENAEKNLEKYELGAPFSGIVSQVGLFVGDNLIDQDKTKSISLQNPFIVEIQVLVDQVDLVKISRGQETQIYFDAYSEKVFSGSVIDISGTPNTDTGVSKYEVKVLADTQDIEEKIYSGMSARVEILIQKLPDVIAISSLSLETNPETGETFVTVVGTNNIREKRVVQSGFTDGVSTEVLSGLSVGEKIIEINFSQNPLPDESFGNPYGSSTGF